MRVGEWGSLFKETVYGWWEDKAPRLGASLAYYTVLSLAPLLVLVTPLAGMLFGEKEAREQIAVQFTHLFGREAGNAVGAMLVVGAPERPSTAATVLSIALLLFAASGVFAELQDAMDTIWEVVPKPGNKAALLSLVRQRVLSFAMVMVIGFLLLMSLVLSSALALMRDYARRSYADPQVEQQVDQFAWLWTLAHGVVSILVVTVLFAMIFKVLPDVRLRWRDVWLGAALTSILFAVGRYLIGAYMGRTTIWMSEGVGKSLVVLLVWIYYSAQILILGAEFTKAYANRTRGPVAPTEVAVPVTEEARAQQGIPKQEVVEAVAEVVRKKQEEEDEAKSPAPHIDNG